MPAFLECHRNIVVISFIHVIKALVYLPCLIFKCSVKDAKYHVYKICYLFTIKIGIVELNARVQKQLNIHNLTICTSNCATKRRKKIAHDHKTSDI